MKKPSIFSTLADAVRADGWSNALTGLGTTRDKLTATTFGRGRVLGEAELEALYAENDMAARICDALPEDATREGYQISSDGGDADAAQAHLDDLDPLDKITEAWVWGRVFGWGAVILGADDGARDTALADPLQVDRVRRFDHLNVVDRRYATPLSWYGDPTQAGYGKPRTYLITPSALPSGPTSLRSAVGAPLSARVEAARRIRGTIELHESRLIVFGGVRTTIQRRRMNQGFDDPLLQRVHTVLTQFGVAWDSLAHILQDGYQGVYKVKGLIDAIAGTDPDALQTRLSLMDMARSAVRSVIVDADMEEFERQSLQLSGLDKIMELFMLRLAAAAGMPATVLMAQSPAGMNATGESDMQWWYDRVEHARESILRPALRRMAELSFAAGIGSAPSDWSITFPPLWAPSATEAATMRLQQAQTDQIYYDLGVLTESEIALSRFGVDGWSAETQIDRDAREAMAEDEVAELGEPDPEPPPTVPPSTAPPAPEPEPED